MNKQNNVVNEEGFADLFYLKAILLKYTNVQLSQ